MTDRVHKFVWRGKGPRAFNAPMAPEVVGEEIRRIDREIGPVTPRVLLEESRPATAPLHEIFEWNDKRAAEKWRGYQAQEAIMCLQVVVKEGSVPIPATAYIVVDEGGDQAGRGHVSMMAVLDDAPRRREFLLKELTTIEGHLRRTEGFAEMEPLRDAAAEVRAALAGDGKAAAA